jgi:glutaredoxin-related protein
MPRPVLDEQHIHPAIRERIERPRQLVEEVRKAVASNAVVVVGMAGNPHCKRARRLLDGAGVAYQYLEYGSYLSRWRERTTLKMWTGWPTLPMVFVRGTLVGGATDLAQLIERGELKTLLA